MKNTRVKVSPLVLVLMIAGSLLSGCSGSDTAQPGQSTESSEASTSDWNCESRQDGLGETLGCRSQVEDDEGMFWTFMLMCTSDLRTVHSITGIYPSTALILWPTENSAKIRIDSGPLEELGATAKGSGQGLVFQQSQSTSEDSATWDLMSKIASAKTFGFKAQDADGYARSALFNVAGSVPIAAKFSVLGCKSS